MKSFFKKYGKYIFLFFLFLYCLMIAYNLFFGDTIVNYGFSYAIERGQIPYRDFNLVIPLFSPLLYAIPLFFCSSIWTYYIMQAVLLSLLFVVLFKIIKEKTWCLFPLLFLGFPIPLFSALFPGYNFILFFLIILLVYLEQKQSHDYFIGFLIGLAILTKHTIGIFLILPSLFYIRDIKKIGRRAIGALIPCCLFLIYLLLTGTFFDFFNLCILGLFDFASQNTMIQDPFLIFIFLLCLCIFIFFIKKNSKDICIYYLFSTILFCFPLFDWYHLSYFILATVILCLKKVVFSCSKLIPFILLFSFCLIGIWTVIMFCYQNGTYYFKNYTDYPLRYISEKDDKNLDILNSYMTKNKKTVLFSLGTENYFYKITHNQDITYFDLPNYGNYGYRGTDLMKKKFSNLEEGTIILVCGSALKNDSYHQQYHKELVSFIQQEYQYCSKVGKYEAYLKGKGTCPSAEVL